MNEKVVKKAKTGKASDRKGERQESEAKSADKQSKIDKVIVSEQADREQPSSSSRPDGVSSSVIE